MTSPAFHLKSEKYDSDMRIKLVRLTGNQMFSRFLKSLCELMRVHVCVCMYSISGCMGLLAQPAEFHLGTVTNELRPRSLFC